MSYVLIIGAKSDIAGAVAREYAKQGYDIYLAARKSDELESLAKDIVVRTKQNIHIIELDILKYQTHQAFYEQLEPKPIGVITAVGYLGNQENAQSDFNEAHRIMETNYTGVVSVLNIIADDFAKRQSGFIVGISSVAGDRGRKSNYLYGSAKAAFTAYLSGLRHRLHSSNVQVLTVKPGFVATKMTQGMDLPKKLTTDPETVAKAIYQAQQKGKDIIYIKSLWRWIMLIIRAIPEWKFKDMNI